MDEDDNGVTAPPLDVLARAADYALVALSELRAVSKESVVLNNQ